MNIFTSNQVNQVYVVKSVETSSASGVTTEGEIFVTKNADNDMYFVHKGKGGITRSDLIPVSNITYANKIMASTVKTEAALITLNTAALNSTYTFPQDYILNLEFQNPIGMSPDNKYLVTAAVHGTATMTASDFYKKMASVLAKNLAKLGTKLLTVYVTYSTNSETEVTASTNINTLAETYTGIKIVAIEPDWIRGLKQQKPIMFNIIESIILNSTKEEIYWADVVYSNGKTITGGVEPTLGTTSSSLPEGTAICNGKLMADLEYFAHGERGDQYRLKSYPDYIPTEYMVDPAKDYDIINIHYSYVGSNHAVQKSEKDITLLVERDSLVTGGAAFDSKTTTLMGAIDNIINPPIMTTYEDASGEALNLNDALEDLDDRVSDLEAAEA